jgi:ribonucleoside-diphosphate reductase alpha chain
MGLAEYLFSKKLRYGSKKAIDEIEKLIKFIRDAAYEASVEIAIEKGAFPKFDPVQYGKAHFIRTLPAALRMLIKDKGIRNVTLMAMAPTGTISLIPEVSSGIEPLFSKAYLRKDRVSERVYIHHLYKAIMESGEELPEWFVDVKDLKPADHFETQSIIQRYTDGAVSKTVNMPKGTTSEDLSRLTLEYIRDLKGLTVYVDESREGQILTHMTDKEVRNYIKSSKEVEKSASEETVRCASGSCEL